MQINNVKYFSSILIILSLLLNSCLPDDDYKTAINFEPVDTGDGWEISTPAEHGFNKDRLQDIYEMMFARDTFLTSRSLLIVRNGKLVSESYFRDREDINRKDNIQGITKSITSLLVGTAWDRDLISLDHRLYRYIPGYFDADMNKRDINVEHMLTMTIGLDWDDEEHTVNLFNINRFPSSMRVVLTKPFLEPAGTGFFYNHGVPQLAMGIVRHAFEYETTDSVVHKLFDPLGIDDFVWEQHTDGLHIGGLGLHMRPRDLALIGRFCLQKGWWDGKQVVSSEWLNISTSEHIKPEMTRSSLGYGYYWWTHARNKAYLGMGEGGQYLYIVPGRNLVIVHTANPHVGSGYDGITTEDFLVVADMILEAIE